MSLALVDVRTSTDLSSALKGIDISVPARTGGRRTHHTETYIACRLLSTLTANNRLTFPLSVIRRDPPDDRPDVLMHAGNARVGIEITEAIPEQFAALCALAEKEFPDRWLPVEVFQWHSGVLSRDDMRAVLRADARAVDGWCGDTPEMKWALFMKRVIESKLAKLAQDGFKKFDQNWLSIYDNLPLLNVHLARAIGFLTPWLVGIWAAVPTFDAIFVERGPVIAEVTAKGSEHLVVSDLWGS